MLESSPLAGNWKEPLTLNQKFPRVTQLLNPMGHTLFREQEAGLGGATGDE